MIEVGGSEACPCGSGRMYKQCCEPAGVIYRQAWRTAEGAVVSFPEEQLRMRAEALLIHAEKPFQHFRFDTRSADQYLRELYRRYDELNALFTAHISCASGCTACCFYHAGCSYLEAETVRHYARKKLSPAALAAIDERAASQRAHYIRENRRSKNQAEDAKQLAGFYQKQLPCIFLSPKSGCLIYEVRPLTCRAHTALTPPDRCATGQGIELLDVLNLSQYLGTNLAELSELAAGNRRWEHIGIWFADAPFLKPPARFKPVRH